VDSFEEINVAKSAQIHSSMNIAKMRENMNRTEIFTKRDQNNTSYCSTKGAYQSAARQTLTALANNNPGPGAYKTLYDNIMRKNPRPIIGTSKRKELTGKDILNAPGPANYLPSIDAVKRSPNHWTIGTEKRDGSITLRESS
jgi:hypothetical protein